MWNANTDAVAVANLNLFPQPTPFLSYISIYMCVVVSAFAPSLPLSSGLP